MFGLLLNIDFIVAALIILVALYAFSKKKYSDISKANKIFYWMVRVAIITCCFNIFMNVIITYPKVFSSSLYMIVRLLFNCGTATITFLAYMYSRMYKKSDRAKYVTRVIDGSIHLSYLLYIILLIVNIFTGVVAYMDENGVYCKGPLFYMTMIVPAIMFILLLGFMIIHRADYTRQQANSIVVYFLTTFIFVGIEILVPDVPLTMFGVAISMVVIQQSLRSPEFFELELALEEQKRISDEAKEARQEAVEAQKEAEEANNAKSSFLARMSHEIRTPLNAVIGFNSIIINEAENENVRTYAKDAKTAGETLLGLINDILDFSKIESGKLSLIDDEYSFEELIRDEYLMFNFKAQDKGLELIFDVDANIPSKLFGDELRIKQIITNVLSNAVKYTEKGSVTLKAILESVSDDIAKIRIEVIDTGMGIRDEDLEKLFSAFERIEEKKNRNIEGTGLGVNICAQLLAMMGSKLEVSSEYGKGSVFSFVLTQKVVDKTTVGDFDRLLAGKAIETDTVEETIESEAKILVVDDTALNLKVFKGMLRNSKLDIDTAQSGKEALAKTLVSKYDLIFMDHMMPEMDGIEALKAIRNQEGLNTYTPVIAITANAIKGAYEEYVGYGFIDALFKPVKYEELRNILNKYLDANGLYKE